MVIILNYNQVDIIFVLNAILLVKHAQVKEINLI